MKLLVQDWMPQKKTLLPFYKGIDNFLNDFIDQSEVFDEKNSKIIADPLLGYIHFSPLEMAIIDTKLFQRLRRIKQLGLAYLVFPSLEYSRFEHSLGVLGRVNQIVNKLMENNARNNNDDNISKLINKHSVSLRLAALLHDCGHCIFSHCSERVIESIEGNIDYPSAKEIMTEFTVHFHKEHQIPFAELFSITIIGSEKFYDFIAQTGVFPPKDVKVILENTARFILGLPVKNDLNTLFLAQLISSGLDADKIDYMIREQLYSGIKLEIDLDRILSKMQVFEIDSFQLPKNLEFLKTQYEANTKCKILGFAKGGQFAFEEFCIARLALHVKIYLHQKVRAAEAQLSEYLRSITTNESFKELHKWLYLSDSIVDYPETINKYLSTNLFNQDEISQIKLQQEKLKQIANRTIYHRAFAFGPINNLSENDIKEMANFFELFREEKELLTNLIKEETIKIAKELLSEEELKSIYRNIDEIIIDLPRLMNIQQGQESLFFERSNIIPLKWTIPIDKITIYFQENRALAYVFAPESICGIVNVAAEKIIFDKIYKVFNQDGHISKGTFEQRFEYKKDLTQKGYYKKYPLLKDTSPYLRTTDAIEKIVKIHDKLSSFKSLNDNERVSINKITSFVNQFPKELQNACLAFLLHLEIYQENLLSIELEKLLNSINKKNTKIGLAYLGGAADSGGRLTYYIRNIVEKLKLKDVQSLNEKMIQTSDVIIIYDDNINSGLQLLNIFAELLGKKDDLPQHLRLENEEHLKELETEELKKDFKKKSIYLVYIVAVEGVEKKIKDLLHTYLDMESDNINIIASRTLYDNEKIFSGAESKFNHEKKIELRNYLKDIGQKLLLSEGKKPERVESGKLGYANAEAMVLFPYNIPTMTVTALWCKGKIDDEIWIPLVERRRRSKKDDESTYYIGED